MLKDNQACLKLACSEMPKLMLRSKHIAVKYHWFREKLEPMKILILPIKSAEQLVDIFTKGLVKADFVVNRRLVREW